MTLARMTVAATALFTMALAGRWARRRCNPAFTTYTDATAWLAASAALRPIALTPLGTRSVETADGTRRLREP
jgi:hypothetical protein